MTQHQDPDERRIQHLLRHQAERRAVTPSRIIPPGMPLPDHPPGPGDIPPWRTPPAPAAPPAPPAGPPERFVFLPPPPPPGPIEVHVRLLPVELPPEPTRWERAWAWVTGIAAPWKICVALGATLLPIPGVGYSVAGVWAYCVGDARETFGVPYGYGLALVPLTITLRVFSKTRALRWFVASTIGLVGLTFGAFRPFDIVTIVTGVTR
ncbi:hypothetical protein ACF09L_32700 [Streptomyces sp. NPDC014779]|uniref:hypothetical protein n=1 Tax=Streptomyces sp. NPDC014779 TaxID=3364911 RepID=UPI0036F4D583